MPFPDLAAGKLSVDLKSQASECSLRFSGEATVIPI
jgi:hypothetical protein